MERNVTIECPDGFHLAGTVYRPAELKSAVMIAPATGIKRQFYHAFSNYLAQNGFGVLTFDNRGIGGSVGRDINEVGASLVVWGRLDMTAVLGELKRLFPGTAYHLVGHSAGGQLIGLMENPFSLCSVFNVGCSSGSLKYTKYPFKFKSMFWLNGVIPASNLIFGHTKSQWFGMGEPLPRLAGSQWRKWCNGIGYAEVDFGKAIEHHFYDQLKMPSQWVHANDDEIANHENVKDMIRVYSKMDAKILTIDPASFGYKDIGHMKFFSSRRDKLWVLALEWLNSKHRHKQ